MAPEDALAPAGRSPDRRVYFTRSVAQFWTSADQLFSLAVGGHEPRARSLIRTSLEPQLAGITSAVARLLVQNNETEERATDRIQGIYTGVERNVYFFLTAALTAIVLPSLYLIRSNRRLVDRAS